MQTTMNLLAAALDAQPAARWTEKLQLSSGALSAAKTRGHLSPAIAGALAEELGQDSEKWMVIAALESERDSACKTRMVRKILGRAALASIIGLTAITSLLIAPSQALARDTGELCILCQI